MDLLKSSIHKQTNVFTEMLLDNGMIPTITKPTRISKTTVTLIDNILVSEDLQETFNSGILKDNSSDHLPCYTTLENILLSKRAPTRITGRDMRPKSMDRLKEKLKNEDWNIDHNLPLNENFKNFHNNFTELVDHFLPTTNRIVCNKTLQREPWLTPGIMKSINKCKQLYHKMLKNENPTSRTKYTEYNSTLQKIKRHAHKYYFKSKCAENKSNTKELWHLINKAAGKISDKTSIIEYLNSNGLQLHNPEDITNKFGEYFSTVGSNFAEKIASPNKSINKYLCSIRSNEKLLFLHLTTPCEILKLMKHLPNKRSSGHDGINNIVLKEISEYICIPMTCLFNESMTTGVFPDVMKIAEVVPLYKGKDRYKVENYRSISLLLTISKLLEKLIYSRVYDFLISSNQLYESQYGF